jgi:hypothetical protein
MQPERLYAMMLKHKCGLTGIFTRWCPYMRGSRHSITLPAHEWCDPAPLWAIDATPVSSICSRRNL